MSLDNIIFPDLVLKNLYANSLIDSNKFQGTSNIGEVTLSFLGNNNKQITIIVDDADAAYLSDEALNFLLGILTACKLSMADIALINLNKKPAINYQDISQQLHANKIFLFGTSPADLDLPLQFPHYQVQHFNNQVYLSAPTLTELKHDKNEKTKLWNCLKQIFSIS